MTEKNPYNICTWDEKADCDNCRNQGVLHCKWSVRGLLGFLFPALVYSLVAIFGMVLTGFLTKTWWPLLAFGAFCIFFFVFFEIRILCSHCPYYARSEPILHCLANHGIIKLWHYHPEPMNKFEKTALVICFLIFGLFPLGTQAYGVLFVTSKISTLDMWALIAMAGITGATLLIGVAFFVVLQVFFCPRCVNFSCPFNRVPRQQVDEYLRHNPVMGEAWEKAGYKIGG